MTANSPAALHQDGACRHPTLRWLLEFPGQIGDIFFDASTRVDASTRDPWPEEPGRNRELEPWVRRSARGNAYLSLEDGLSACWLDANLVTWASWKSTLFMVGGVHGESEFASDLLAFRRSAQTAGFRRLLAFPVDQSEIAEYGKAGFGALMVGSDATFVPKDFSLAGVHRADLRQMVNRGRKRYGLRVEEVSFNENRDALEFVYSRWLASRMIRRPMRLVVGTPCLSRLEGRRVFAVKDEHGEPSAFITLTPGWNGQGYGVDVMARAPDAPAGAMELLISTVIQRFADEGIAHFSLGSCPMFEAATPQNGDSALLRALCRRLYRSSIGNRLFPFRALARFKAKFFPIWRPVYLAASPRVDIRALYQGCRMWGLFGEARIDPPRSSSDILISPARPGASLLPPWRAFLGKKV